MVEHYDNASVELFDLQSDVGETHDLSTVERSRAGELRTRLRNWRRAIGAQENTRNPAFNGDMYRQIYVDFDSTRFNPLQADENAWKAVAVWRQRMDAAIRPPAR